MGGWKQQGHVPELSTVLGQSELLAEGSRRNCCKREASQERPMRQGSSGPRIHGTAEVTQKRARLSTQQFTTYHIITVRRFNHSHEYVRLLPRIRTHAMHELPELHRLRSIILVCCSLVSTSGRPHRLSHFRRIYSSRSKRNRVSTYQPLCASVVDCLLHYPVCVDGLPGRRDAPHPNGPRRRS